MGRRLVLIVFATTAAFVSGLLVARLWFAPTAPTDTGVQRPLAPSLPADSGVERLLAHSFTAVDGGTHSLTKWRGKTLLVNFWATWCKPCREEIPLLQAIQDQHRAQGLQVVGIAFDTAEPVRRFRDEMDIRYPLLLDGGSAATLMADYGNPSGALPYSLVFSDRGELVRQKLGVFTGPELEGAIRTALTHPQH